MIRPLCVVSLSIVSNAKTTMASVNGNIFAKRRNSVNVLVPKIFIAEKFAGVPQAEIGATLACAHVFGTSAYERIISCM